MSEPSSDEVKGSGPPQDNTVQTNKPEIHLSLDNVGSVGSDQVCPDRNKEVVNSDHPLQPELDDVRIRQKRSLPRNFSYEARRVIRKKIYSPTENDKAKLLKDQICETRLSSTKGSMEDIGDRTVSDTDIIAHGLNVLLKTKEESLKSVELPDLKNVLNLMQLTPEELSAVQEWLNKKYELSLMYEKEIKALLVFVKKTLAEVKQLRQITGRYRKQIKKMESELYVHPSPGALSDLYKESERLRKEIATLDQQHREVVKSKYHLYTLVQKELQTFNELGDSLSDRVQTLKYENKTLCHMVEVFSREARKTSESLFKRFDNSLRIIKRLEGLLQRAKALLDKKNSQTKEVEAHLKDQNKLVEGLHDSISFIQQHITSLRTNATNMQNKSTKLTLHVVQLRNEIEDLIGNFNSFSERLTDKNKLREEKKKNASQVKEIFDSLETEKKNLKKLEKNIAKLEKHVQSSEAKDRREGENIISVSKMEYREDRERWEDKMIELRNFFEEMDELITSIREEEEKRRRKLKEAGKRDTADKVQKLPFHSIVHGSEGMVKLTGRFICSDATQEEVVTKSGACKIVETVNGQDGGIRSFHSSENVRAVTSAYTVGLQDLTSVPESTESQLRGTYAKYRLRQSEEMV